MDELKSAFNELTLRLAQDVEMHWVHKLHKMFELIESRIRSLIK